MKRTIRLRFSKSGDPGIEKRYSTHYVDKARIAELKEEKMTTEIDGDTGKGGLTNGQI